ncbi:DUF4143 domain-containing protein [Corynebacterium felinum]|uniref:AAA+ superfamily ATPase n=1 Tax=Corynebacterium felinum TaxID=131318 RepID=A0ABU2BCC8_9CORY|nr:DUF4143 domain-containing protein [Corynebacterium felinum]MDF5820678.1 DUF4143 domain-containing protein [Corynebacterium felinum]MDR7356258.1 putative AAA+ superfamily ATPase [Corynebacterium felinum]WJY95590.1 hypothetical protein CFELI_09945 [Corynebacterium felinum]
MSASYRKRIVDQELHSTLNRAGAVLIQGAKACGKTETALQVAGSVITMDTNPQASRLMSIDPHLLLVGPTPRLIDEWQIHPEIWNYVKRAVDDRKTPGQFILTGSTAPQAEESRHSGAGRFARLTMRTMTFVETGHSSEEISLHDVLDNAPIQAMSDKHIDFHTLITRIAVGGWPGNLTLNTEDALEMNKDYVETIAFAEVQNFNLRNSVKMRRLLTSLGRAIGTEMNVSTIASDIGAGHKSTNLYLDVLRQLFIVEEQPAWSSHLRSRAQLRKTPKLHLADPSLAVAALSATPTTLLEQLEYTGQLFESQVVHDLRVLSGQPVFHARDNSGAEVDAIIDYPDGKLLLVEVKLGQNDAVVEQAARSLNRFANKLNRDDVSKMIITSGGFGYRRIEDNIAVVPFTALTL